MSSSNTTQPNSEPEMEKALPLVTAPKESPTSLPVHQKESLSQSRLKQRKELPPQSNLVSSKTSEEIEVSASLPTRWTKLWQLFKALPSALFLWTMFKLTRKLLQWRTRAMPILIYPDPRLKRIAEPVDFEKTTLEQRVKIVRKLGAALAKQTYG